MKSDKIKKVRNEEAHEHSADDGHDHGTEAPGWNAHWDLLLAFVKLIILVVLEYGF